MSSSAPASHPTRFIALAGGEQQAVEVEALGEGRYRVTVDGRVHLVDSHPTGAASFSLLIGNAAAEVHVIATGDTYTVEAGGRGHRIQLLDERAVRRRRQAPAGDGDRELRSAMPGKVVVVLVQPGDVVEAGQGLLIIEAMKMENEVGSPRAGTVREIRVEPGQTIESGELLAIID